MPYHASCRMCIIDMRSDVIRFCVSAVLENRIRRTLVDTTPKNYNPVVLWTTWKMATGKASKAIGIGQPGPTRTS